MDYLFDEVIGNANSLGSVHHFVWDRTRAIRNDFSIQQLSKISDLRIAIECYEKIARFHILSLHQLALKAKPYDKYDWYQEREQLDRTLLSLMQYYDDSREQIHSPNEAEFRAYCIIFQIQSPIPDMEDRAQTWPQHILFNMRVQKALELYAAACNVADAQGPLKPRAPHAIAQANWEKFWALIRSNETSYLMSCVAEIYFNLIRRTALVAIWKASRQGGKMKVDGWTIPKLVKVLGFDKTRQVEDFCAHYGFSIERGDDGKRFLDLNSVRGRNIPQPTPGLKEQIKSEKIVEVKRHNRTLPAVIKGLSVEAAQAAGLIETKINADEAQAGGNFSTKTHSKKGHNRLGDVEDDATDSDSLFVGQDPSVKEQSSQTAPHVLTNGVKFDAAAVTRFPQNINGNDSISESRAEGTVKPASSIFSRDKGASGINGVTSFGKPSAPANSVNSFSPKPLFNSSYENSTKGPKESTPPFNNNQSPFGLFGSNQTSYTKATDTNPLQPELALPSEKLGTNGNGRKLDQVPLEFKFEGSQFSGKTFVFPGSNIKAEDSPTRSPFSAPPEINKETKSTDASSSTVQTKNDHTKGLDSSKFISGNTAPNEAFSFTKSNEPPITLSSTRPTFPDNSLLGTDGFLPQPKTAESIPPVQQKQAMPLSDKKISNNNNSSSTTADTDPNINSKQPVPTNSTTSIFETQRKAFDKLAKHMVLNAETGFLTQFIEYTIGPVISESIKQIAQEQLHQRAMHFRHNWLAARYGRAWKEVAWHLKLARQGRKRRARVAQKREERARMVEGSVDRDVRDFEDLVRNGINGRGESGVGSRRETKLVGRKVKDREGKERQKCDRSLEDGLENRTKSLGKSHKEDDFEDSWERPREKHEELAQSPFCQTNFSTSTGLERKSTTKTNYFRLKALGIQPQGQNLWDRPTIKPNPSPSPSTSPSPSPSPSPLPLSIPPSGAVKPPKRTSMTSIVRMASRPTSLPSRRSLLTSTKIPTCNGKREVKKEEEGVVEDMSATRRGVKRRNSYMSDTEQQDEALFARLRAAKEALQESISFFREEMATGNASIVDSAAFDDDGKDGIGNDRRRRDRFNDDDKHTRGSAASYLSNKSIY